MLKSLQELVNHLNKLGYLKPLIISVKIAGSTLGLVYMVGRLLELVKKDHAKNLVAFIGLWAFSFLYVYMDISKDLTKHDFWFNVVRYATYAAIPYILVGWRLFTLVQKILTKKGWLGKLRRRK